MLLMAACPVKSLELADGNLQLHGFFTQGAVYATHNNFYGNTDDHVGLDFREVGLNVSTQPFSRLRLAAQGVSRWAGQVDQGQPWLDFALADVTFFNDETLRAGIRLGRMKNPYGLYTETRDVAFTRPGAFLPQSIYIDRSRKFALSGDGFHLYGDLQVPGGTLNATFALIDLPINDDSSKATLVGLNSRGDFEQDRMTPGFRLLYETANGRWRGGFTYSSLSQRYSAAAGERYPNGHILLEPWIVSLQYTDEDWTLTSEYSQRYNDFRFQGRPDNRGTSENWYVQAEYRVAPQWELLLRYDQSIQDIDDPDGQKFAAQFQRPAFTRYARDLTTGVRFDVNANFMLRAEYHHIDGANWLSPLDNPDPGNLQRNWDMFVVLGSFHF